MNYNDWFSERLDRYTGRLWRTDFPSNDDAASQDGCKSKWQRGGRYARYQEVFPVNHREPASKQPRRRWLLIIRPCPCQLINNKCTPPPQTDLQRPWQRERVLFCKNLKLGIRPTEKCSVKLNSTKFHHQIMLKTEMMLSI